MGDRLGLTEEDIASEDRILALEIAIVEARSGLTDAEVLAALGRVSNRIVKRMLDRESAS